MFKRCTICKIEKSIVDFRRDKTRLDGHQPHCKACARAHHKSAYVTKYKQRIQERGAARAAKHALVIRNYKETHPCCYCGEADPVCLEFHHPDSSEKEFGIAGGLSRSLDKIISEMQKCIVVCSNCHKKLHAGRFTVA